MTPAQRIVKVLAAGGIEATPEEVDDWIDAFLSEVRDRWGVVIEPEAAGAGLVAETIERGYKGPTVALHLRFGGG